VTKIAWEVLGEATLERIDEESLRLLERVGLAVFHDELRDLLARRGAQVIGERVRFPRQLVRAAVAAAPMCLSLFGRDGRELRLSPGNSYFCCYGDALYVTDYGATAQRPSTKQDVVDFTRLSDALPVIDKVNNACHARDMAAAVQILHTLEAVLCNTQKALGFGPQNVAEAEIVYDMVSIASGAPLAEHPAMHSVVSTTSPLQVDADSARVLMFMAQRRVPLTVASCPMSGATAPFSLLGTLVLQNAENLALITMVQCVQEGAPVIMGGAAGPMDPRSGRLAYGAPERSLLIAANNQIQRFYGLPTHAASIATNSWQPDVQTGAERMLIVFVRRMLRPNIWGGAGGLCSGKTVSLEQMVIDEHIVQMVDRFMRGVDVSEEVWATEDIERVGPGGSFLLEPLTLRLMRRGEMLVSPLVNMEEERGASMVERAHQRVLDILAMHQSPVDETVVQDLRRYVQERSRQVLARD
jgi:trimethylamine--corrinoid protein Co-methyltransferase